MNGSQLPTNQLHDINWDALDRASPPLQLMSCNYYYMYVCVYNYVCTQYSTVNRYNKDILGSAQQ